MLEAIREFGQSGAIMLLSLATGAAWMMAIVSPNVSYDRLDASRADGHIRQMVKSGSDPIAFILLAAGALAILGGALAGGITAFLAALGFFSNRWTLSKLKTAPAGVRRRRKTQRVVAVSLTLIFTLVTAIAAGLAFFGV